LLKVPGEQLTLAADFKAFSLKLGKKSLTVSRSSSKETGAPFAERSFA
jgi:hypothetical protein